MMNRFKETTHKGWLTAKKYAGTTLAGAGLFFLSFILVVHLFFPVAALQRRLIGEIEARTPLRVQVERLSLAPVFTLRGEQATITLDNSSMPAVVLSDLRLKPLWATLFTGNQGLSLEAALLQGRLNATVRRNGETAIHAAGVKLTGFPIHQEAGVLLSGTIVKWQLQKSLPAKKPAENRLSVELDNAILSALGQPLNLGKIAIEGSGQGNNLRIAALTANGGDVIITGTGMLLFGASTATSHINLDLTLRPARTTTPAISSLLDLAASRQADGSYRLRLSGSPGKPTIEKAAAMTARPAEATDDE